MPEEPQENRRRSFLLPSIPTFNLRKDRQYQNKTGRPRWVLHMQATFWRVLMSLGMFFHKLAPPRPPHPNFYRVIDTHVSGKPGQITLYFYVPSDYETRSRTMRRWGGYPVVINFHGGGFTLGSPHDDARWCGTVVAENNAVVVSVDYRLAPEYPFPTAVEDGVDAVIWIWKHAEELGIDRNKIAISGFSSGGNMTFSVPMRLYDQQTGFARDDSDLESGNEAVDHGDVTVHDPPPGSSASHLTAASTATTAVPQSQENDQLIDPNGPPPQTPSSRGKAAATAIERSVTIPQIQIKCLVSWYPSLDYTRTREERRATCVRADQELPALFTDLFDDSYLHPPKDVALDSPYLSPGVAPTSLLRNAIPEEIIMHTCEWDMLLDEGREFYERLASEEVGKHVNYTMVEGVPHGWDKAPNPWKPTPGVREHYLKACKEMRRIMGERRNSEMPEAQPRKSIVR
ncbi:hypothetical protein M409DRAFT_65951 [Zasmidium cellare ATCC 36951]|uniref:Alpha/beta hydrolase fold-3 domain-containing protein n=1 Tax=Zasmidium cellare ATCC 36951 TaxID=1080233 RepID=A0A6A6CMP0_ZASCE|nr:uncharacterized protein M409DRAFT_65951 [Zasmidium cellare ATCC 36951]KAF2167893.1 hypothetical protein M409DRAFT_65951 [Zasmidium cellare ATCC 36951]